MALKGAAKGAKRCKGKKGQAFKACVKRVAKGGKP